MSELEHKYDNFESYQIPVELELSSLATKLPATSLQPSADIELQEFLTPSSSNSLNMQPSSVPSINTNPIVNTLIVDPLLGVHPTTTPTTTPHSSSTSSPESLFRLPIIHSVNQGLPVASAHVGEISSSSSSAESVVVSSLKQEIRDMKDTIRNLVSSLSRERMDKELEVAERIGNRLPFSGSMVPTPGSMSTSGFVIPPRFRMPEAYRQTTNSTIPSSVPIPTGDSLIVSTGIGGGYRSVLVQPSPRNIKNKVGSFTKQQTDSSSGVSSFPTPGHRTKLSSTSTNSDDTIPVGDFGRNVDELHSQSGHSTSHNQTRESLERETNTHSSNRRSSDLNIGRGSSNVFDRHRNNNVEESNGRSGDIQSRARDDPPANDPSDSSSSSESDSDDEDDDFNKKKKKRKEKVIRTCCSEHNIIYPIFTLLFANNSAQTTMLAQVSPHQTLCTLFLHPYTSSRENSGCGAVWGRLSHSLKLTQLAEIHTLAGISTLSFQLYCSSARRLVVSILRFNTKQYCSLLFLVLYPNFIYCFSSFTTC